MKVKLSRKLQKTNKDQFILTIPKTIVQLLNWKNKDEIEFGFEKGKITITKAKEKGAARNKVPLVPFSRGEKGVKK